MDELKKLLENAGLENEMTPHPSEAQSAVLDQLSDSYQFEIDDDGSIHVYVKTDKGSQLIGSFDSFDDMLNSFGHM